MSIKLIIEKILGKDNGAVKPDTLSTAYPKINRNFEQAKIIIDDTRADVDNQLQRLAEVEAGSQDGEVLAARGAYPSLKDRLNSLDPGLMISRKTFTATEGQTVFDISSVGAYSTGQNRLAVTVGGVPQFSGIHFTETSTTKFTLSEGVAAGTTVIAQWYEGAISLLSGHARKHQAGGGDELDITTLAGYDKINAQLAENTEQRELSKVQVEPLHIKTFDGTDQPLHPSVYYNEAGWNGKKFWMAYTPFPIAGLPYMDRWECPCIVSSINGVDWSVPFGAPNPLIDLTAEEIDRKDYFSDPCIVMNGNTMEVWYRKTNGANTAITDIYRVTSVDGIAWSQPELVLDSQNASNGFGTMQTMRAQQVFYDGAKYTAFFGLQGGSGFWRAETSNPASGVWSNLTRLKFSMSPDGMSLWHNGLYIDNGVYHLTGYDDANNAIQYFTSPDGFNFAFGGTIIKTDENAQSYSYYSLYQTVPIKVKNEWFLYSSGTFRGSGLSKRGIALYSGKSLTTLVPVKGGLKRYRQYFDETPVLNNVVNNNSNDQKYYATYFDFVRNRFSGYRMNFGSLNHAPAWFDRSKVRPITFVFDDVTDPSTTPEHVGMIHRNINTKAMWIAVGTSSVSDWKALKIGDSVVNKQRTNVTAASTLDVTNTYRLVINGGVATTITNLTGLVDGQELWILNTISAPMTIQHNAAGSGAIRLKGATNVVLNQYESISLIAVTSTWYQK